MRISGNTFLITGGATGIGFALAQRFIASGNTVIACGRRKTALKEAASRLPGLVTRPCDVTSDSDREKLVEWLLNEFSGLNVLINNAGVQHSGGFSGKVGDPEKIEAEIATNLTAPILLTALLLPHLQKQSDSTIINVTSGLAFCPIAFMPVYCATKAAFHSYTISLRRQLRDSGIRVVEFIPPMVDTELNSAGRRDRSRPPHMMSPEDFASEAIRRLSAGEVEIGVGGADHLRKQGESLFDSMNQ